MESPGSEGLFAVLGRAATILLPVLLISSVSCAFGHYFLHIALDQLAVVVSIPLTAGFIVTKAFVIFLPAPGPPSPVHRPSLLLAILGILTVAAGFWVFSFLTSALLYRLVGLEGLSVDALVASLIGLVITIPAATTILSLAAHSDLSAIGLWSVWKLLLLSRHSLRR